MSLINISKDIVPVGEFKIGISKWLKSIRENNHPVVITQNGRAAGVLISPEEYDLLNYRKEFTNSVNRGISNFESGDYFSTDEAKKMLLNRDIEK